MTLYDKMAAGERITTGEAAELLDGGDLLDLGRLADQRRRQLHPGNAATFQIDRNINYTNICECRCRFCAFFRDADAPDAYLLNIEQVLAKTDEAVRMGATQVMLQGGLHPDLGLEYFEELFRSIKQRFPIIIHSLSPPEVQHLAKLTGLDLPELLQRLRAAGLDSIPGGGAEILSDRVRREISPHKISSAQWLAVMEAAHAIGMHTTATMMIGSVETIAERVEHLALVRDLQDRTGGFRAFIPWTFKPGNSELEPAVEVSAFDYLRLLAVARIYFDNIPNIQGSWLTQGRDIAQVSLHFGANDLGSIMLEENVVAAAGAGSRITEQEMVDLIRRAGRVPKQRNTTYQIVKEYPEPAAGAASD
ncbi:MAG: dehypoxanthine futalosine cyclase [Deltaproteobacteria bacterium]|nr:dehypoxanthine futalosine cyclase [Deltaproteobacteria bacterium]